MKIQYSTRIIIYLVVLAVTFAVVWTYNNKNDDPYKDMVLIPSGEFIIGSNDIDDLAEAQKDFGISMDHFLVNELPVRTISLKAYYIDKFEVTNEKYKMFVETTNHPPPPTWKDKMYPQGKDAYPVQDVSWFNAIKYCEWSGKRLPTEEEWEKAARGPKGNRFPWGNDFGIKKANLDQGHTTPVGSMKEDKSFYDIYDMAGNVMEWTDSWFKPYPGSTEKSRQFGEKNKVVRGWSGSDIQHYNLPYIFSRSSHRHYYEPFQFGEDVGFRCSRDSEK